MKKKSSPQNKPKGNPQSGAQKKRNSQQNFVKSSKVKKFDKNDITADDSNTDSDNDNGAHEVHHKNVVSLPERKENKKPRKNNTSRDSVNKKSKIDSESSDQSESDEDDSSDIVMRSERKDVLDNNGNDSNGSDDDDESDEEDGKNVFSDSNAKWLKPTKKSELLESSDEESNENIKDGDDSEEDEDELLEIEKESKLVDDEMQAEMEEADEEMKRTIAENSSIYHLPTKEEMENDANRVIPPSEIRSHIDSILEVLADFKTRREPGRSRKEYVDQLGTFLSELYGYLPELVEYFLTMFSPTEAVEFIAASDKPRPLVIRTNTIKARRKDLAAALIKRGVTLDPLASWSKVGLKIVDSPVPIGATPEYLSGMYMLQSAASMCPVLALAPQPNEKILDVSAAPGGKTSYIAQLMRNTGVLIANDLKPERQKATVANLHRLGVKNVITTAFDGRKICAELQKNRFDRILLDAPCSGLGIISRDPSVKVQRTIADIQQCAQLQKELLLNAIDCVKFKNTSGGIVVYSTCSVSIYENEDVIQYALSKRNIQIIDSGLDFGTPGYTKYQNKRYHPSIALCKRFYPHTVNMDGFFVCKIRKLSDELPSSSIESAEDKVDASISKDIKNQKENDLIADDREEKSKGERFTKGGAVKIESKKRKNITNKSTGNVDAKKFKQGRNGKNKRETVPSKQYQRKTVPVIEKAKTNAKITKPRRLKPSDSS